jgi:hypothetical protein
LNRTPSRESLVRGNDVLAGGDRRENELARVGRAAHDLDDRLYRCVLDQSRRVRDHGVGREPRFGDFERVLLGRLAKDDLDAGAPRDLSAARLEYRDDPSADDPEPRDTNNVPFHFLPP